MTTYLSLDEIKKLLADDLAEVKGQLTSIANVDAALVTDFTLRTQNRAAKIIAGFASGDIDLAEFKNLLQDEKYIFAGFLDTLEIVAKVDAQDLFKKITTSIAGIIVKIILPA